MENKIRVGIVGYGNLGKGTEASIAQQPDMELVAVFTRRNPDSVNILNSDVNVLHIDEAKNYTDKIDVMLLCGGSATDLPEQVPAFAEMFNTVDSYDTHAKIPEFFASVDKVAQASGKTSIISVGWDPGMFSINRVMSEALLPEGETYTFWGKGLSQGHSDAVRRVEGVKKGVQYTIPSDKVIEQVRNGENPAVSKVDRHVRTCYIVPEEDADTAQIEQEIKTMPNYFADYETTVHFITEEELARNHSSMPHGGFVIRSGKTGEGSNQIAEYNLKLDSNPEFTASVLTAYARAAYRLNKEGQKGAKTVYDVAPGYISPKSAEELRRDYL
ncbi:diaminopimelate dehydrogenase [Virgibacillus sp. NKC19-16]|uniref:diaminopimelate dehydrogenase n=1 Tax=Virgibacillus salidurans TaxID=2831673 RepID=UPI001F1BBCF8|nr:diaminopimelate dehydrogenase [Virgibacillus sp. NKC19-16]UJL46906.1 diaminopimelate dehydrogenase [Virgibacillus sp. NKC19-16]